MANVEELKSTYESAEAKAIKLANEYDQARAAVKDKYADKVQAAAQDAADAQKAWLDAEAAAALLDRPDGEQMAASLGLTLPDAEG